MTTLVPPAAAGVLLDAGEELVAEFEAEPDDVVALDVVALDVFADPLSPKQPATPAMRVTAPTAISNSRFTEFSFG